MDINVDLLQLFINLFDKKTSVGGIRNIPNNKLAE